MLKRYTRLLQKLPIMTKATSAAGIMMVGDVLCQTIDLSTGIAPRETRILHSVTTATHGHIFVGSSMSFRLPRYDLEQSFQAALVGLCFTGPLMHFWYQLLERLATFRYVALGLALRMVLDAVVFSPVAVAGNFTLRSFFEGKTVDETVTKLQLRWWEALKVSWCLWPCVNIVNFAFVPLEFRVLFSNVFSVVWNGFLSHVNSKQLETAELVDVQMPKEFLKGCSQTDGLNCNTVTMRLPGVYCDGGSHMS